MRVQFLAPELATLDLDFPSERFIAAGDGDHLAVGVVRSG